MALRFCVLFVLSLVIAVGALQPAFAGWQDKLSDRYVEKASKHYDKMLEARAVMEAKDSDEWSVTEIQLYQWESLWVVYCGLSAHFFDQHMLPSEVSEESLSAYIKGWPGNPYSDWEPMSVLSIDDDFSPGDLVWQIAPPAEWSLHDLDEERPLSFELAINGSDIAFGELGNAAPCEDNDWAVTPEGALYMLSLYTQNADSSRAKRAAYKVMKEAQAASEDVAESEGSSDSSDAEGSE